MGDIKLFRICEGKAEELESAMASSERELHSLVDMHMKRIFGIKFLAHEYSTGRYARGYIDSLGLDENNCPVIVEYKRRGNDNVINQALYYLDWLLDHKGDFTLLVKEKLGGEAAGNIEFAGARIICVASAFSRFDERAILQIERNIELIRYKLFAGNILMIELLNNSLSLFCQPAGKDEASDGDKELMRPPMSPEMQNRLQHMAPETEILYLALMEFVSEMGEDVTIKFLKHYIALSRLKNFASFVPMRNNLKMWLNLDPARVPLEEGFSRDVRDIGHLGPGNMEIEIASPEDFIKAKPLVQMAYDQN